MRHEFPKTEPRVKVEIIGVAADFKEATETIPLYLNPVQAGFPTPTGDDVDQWLNLHKHLVKHEAATFFLRASGNSMINAGIHDGDLLRLCTIKTFTLSHHLIKILGIGRVARLMYF